MDSDSDIEDLFNIVELANLNAELMEQMQHHAEDNGDEGNPPNQRQFINRVRHDPFAVNDATFYRKYRLHKGNFKIFLFYEKTFTSYMISEKNEILPMIM